MQDWERYLTAEDRAVLEKGRWGRRGGFGVAPAVLAIDCQYYMTGIRDGEQESYPYSCGPLGWAAVDRMAEILAAARRAGAPVVYTRFVVDPERSAGSFARKVGVPQGEHVMRPGTHGAEIVAELRPAPGDPVFDKEKSSAFFGTQVLPWLLERRIDTLIVVGGSTSNCIRATVLDASSYNFRTIVPAEAVFDRIPISHHVSLFDMNRTFADVLPTDEVLGWLDGLPRSNGGPAQLS